MTNNIWQKESSRNILIKWDKMPFKVKTSVRWRSKVFHIQVDAHTTEFGFCQKITIIYNGQRYKCAMQKWKWYGPFSSGKAPEIRTRTHILRINFWKDYVSLLDEDVIPGKESDPGGFSPFEILITPERIVFDDPPKEETLKLKTLNIEKNKVVLYEYSGSGLDINSYAYFENDELVIDHWKLGDRYEDERSIVVKKDQFSKLFKEFEIVNDNRSELLIGILNAFKGKDCFDEIRSYLASRNIKYVSGIPHN